MTPQKQSAPRSALHRPALVAGLLSAMLALSHSTQAQTTAVAGSATNPANGTFPGGSTAGTFIDLADAAAWSAGLPDSNTDATLSGGIVGLSGPLSVRQLNVANTQVYGGAYNVTSSVQTITLGAGGLTTSGTTDPRVASNIILAPSGNQTWTIGGTGRILNMQCSVTGAQTITVDAGVNNVWLRNTGNAFTGQWNVTSGQLRASEARTLGTGAVNVALSNNSTLRLLNAVSYTAPVSIGTGGGQVLSSVSGVILAGEISGTDKLTLGATGNNFSTTFRGDMSAHTGALEIARDVDNFTVNFGSGTNPAAQRTTVSFALGANGFVDGVDTSAGSVTSLIRGGVLTAQVETATAVGTITAAGDASVTVTAAGMTNSPKTIAVPVALNDTAATWGGKVRTALAADVDVAAAFVVGGSSASITLTTRARPGVDDATLNIALADGTSTGITAAPTSVNTAAPVAKAVPVNFTNALFRIVTTGANTTAGNQWRLVDAANLTETYGALFTVENFTKAGTLWTKTDPGKTWTYDEVTGTLSVANNALGNLAPTAVALSSQSIVTGSPVGTAVGTLSSVDSLGDTHTYSLVSGVGSTDNGSFTIDGNILRVASIFDFNVKNSYTVRVRTTDQLGASYEQSFVISVERVSITTTGVSLDLSQPATWTGGVVPGVNDIAVFANPGTYFSPAAVGEVGNFTWAGIRNLVNGTIEINPGTAGNAYTINLGSAGISGTYGITRLGTNLSLNVGANDQVWSIDLGNVQSSILGTAKITYQGAATMNLRGANFGFTGIWRVEGGVILPDTNGNWSGASGATAQLINGGTFRLRDVVYDRVRIELLGDGKIQGGGTNSALNRGTGTDTGDIYGTGNLTITTAALTLNGDVRHTGNTLINTGVTLTLGTPGTLAFYLGANGVTNSLRAGTAGTNTAVLNGSFVIDYSNANLTAGNSWTVMDVANIVETYGTTFSVAGYIKTAPGVWTREDYGHTWTFSEASAVVTVADNTLVNAAPTDIAFANASLPENSTSAITLVTTDGAVDTHTYALVAGTGDTDNAAFTVSGGTLVPVAGFDFETRTSCSVRVRATDQGGLSVERALTLAITNVNEAPTDVSLSPASILEGNAVGAVVGALASTDQDAGDTQTYTLVTGTGDTDNASFTISGGNVLANEIFNAATKSSYSLRVRTTDAGGLSFERALTVTVTAAPVLTPFQQWAATSGLTAGVNDGISQDPDSDGLANIAEFVLGGNPLVASPGVALAASRIGSDYVFDFDRVDASEGAVTVVFRYSTDLVTWTDVAIGATSSTSGIANVQITENDAAPDSVVITIPAAGITRIFGRLQLTQ
jgi:hypothetical protein